MVHDLEGPAFVDMVDRFKADRRSFYLSPERWKSSRVDFALQWAEVKFDPDNANGVPEGKGIYAFIVRHENDHFPPHGYIMYVGITGAGESKRTLRERFHDYVAEQRRNKRPHVHYMLTKYQNDLYFNFVTFDSDDVDLAKLEIDLNDALVPPVGKKDFSGEVKALRDALE